MSETSLREIINRYLELIHELATKAEQGEIVGVLIRRKIRQCVVEMRASGADPEDIRSIFDNLEMQSRQDQSLLEPRFILVLTAAKLHVDFLLFIEGNHLSL